jgi:SPP1 family predicted phage head-tail adaptor
MPDTTLSVREYAEIRDTVTKTLPDDAVVEYATQTETSNGRTPAWSQRSTSKAAVMDLSWQERMQAQAQKLEVTSKVRLVALTSVEHKDRIKVTHWETGAVRTFQVEGLPKPSREFFRDVWCKEYSTT